MDLDAAGFVLDRVDVAREAIKEAQLVVGKFSEPEDARVCQMLEGLLSRVEELDSMIKSRRYSS